MSQLTTHIPESAITVLDPSRTHTFLALVPHSCAAHRSYDIYTKATNSLQATTAWTVPREATLVPSAAVKVDPRRQIVTDAAGGSHPYDYLVIAVGAQRDYSAVKGVTEANANLNRCAVLPHAVRDALCSTHTGNVIFARVLGSGSPYVRPFEGNHISCANMAAKLLSYRNLLRPNCARLLFTTPDTNPSDSLPEEYNKTILSYWAEKGAKLLPHWNLREVNQRDYSATFDTPQGPTTLKYRVLAIDFPLKAPDFVKDSGLSAKGLDGFVAVDPKTLQHVKYPNIFAVGDCAALRSPKSYGAVFVQAPVVTHNIRQLCEGRVPTAEYNGYSSFHIAMTPYRCIWPEVEADETSTKRVNYNLWNNNTWRGLRGTLNGLYLQWALYETMYWFLFLRGWWYPPKYFSYPTFAVGDVVAAPLKALPPAKPHKV